MLLYCGKINLAIPRGADAIPTLVVAIALNPARSNTLADAASQALGQPKYANRDVTLESVRLSYVVLLYSS
jgi:hypothetical protein